ncbi:MAG TPA: hypothetical protein VK146_12600, partial [Tabrizicola sp.]|nr:hypothetical protein [Tabrizicola sp.]
TYQPISTADAVLRYASDFIPSWAGAIAIDLLPAVLVFMMMVAQSAIREGRAIADPEETMSLRDLRAALTALHSIQAENADPRKTAAPAASEDEADPDGLSELGEGAAYDNVAAIDRGARK